MESLDAILNNQPDYQADLIFTDMPEGDLYAGRVASKGGAWRLDTSIPTPPDADDAGPELAPLETSMLLRPGHPPMMLLHNVRGFSEFPSGYAEARTVVLPTMGILFSPDWLADTLAANSTRKVVGNVSVDGHACVKIACSGPESAGVTYLYSAMDLGGLVIKLTPAAGGVAPGLHLRNVSLEVADAVLEAPVDYTPLDATGSSPTHDT